MKCKASVEICEVNFWCQQSFIQWNTDNCCEHITGGVNIYLYRSVSLLALVCAACLCLCVIWNQSTSKKPHYVSDLGKFNALLYKTHKVLLVLRYQCDTNDISLSKITHQMWHDHPFSQKNKATKRASNGGRGFGGGCEQNLKMGGWWYRVIFIN